MSRRTIGWLALVAGAFLALSACENSGLPFAQKSASGGSGGAEPAAAGQEMTFALVERDVEAPSVFDLTDEGLWDGRPSLGGVWVAHSSVKDPERAMIRNPANGKSVVGALFRREVQNPGPSLQVSSDAAEALGMLAGQPAELTVVALRREEPAAPEPAPAEVASGTEPGTGTETVAGGATAAGEAVAAAAPAAEGTGEDIAETALAAIDRAEARPGGAAGAAADTGEALATAETGADAGAPAAKCPFWRKKKCLAEQAAAASAGAAVGETAEAAAPAAAAEGAAAAAPVTSEVLPATPTAAGALTRAYVQIGIFSVEANAQRASDQMKAAGMTATVKPDQSQGKRFWRVIVGPAASVAERDALAARVKGIGYPDAYPVSK